MCDTNVNDDNFEQIKKEDIPDVILVKKIYPNRKRNRRWKLKRLDMDYNDCADDPADDQVFDDFLEDLEDDPQHRKDIDIYRDQRKTVIPIDADDLDDEFQPCITLEEMLEDLSVNDELTPSMDI